MMFGARCWALVGVVIAVACHGGSGSHGDGDGDGDGPGDEGHDAAESGTPPPTAPACAPGSNASATVAEPTILLTLADRWEEAWLGSAAVADIDGDGANEIIVPRGEKLVVWST